MVAIIFIASILVPFIKIIMLFTLLLNIHFKFWHGMKTRVQMLRFVIQIGHWSILDLFVILITLQLVTLSLIDMYQLLALYSGTDQLLFDSAVILAILVTEQLERRLLQDTHATQTDYTD